jgi:hypothetical protein
LVQLNVGIAGKLQHLPQEPASLVLLPSLTESPPTLLAAPVLGDTAVLSPLLAATVALAATVLGDTALLPPLLLAAPAVELDLRDHVVASRNSLVSAK